MKRLLCMTMCAAAVCANAQGAKDAETVQEEKSPLSLNGGLDVRLRYDWYDNLPNGNGSRNGQVSHPYVDYMRLRTRLWGSAYYGDVGIYARLADEFREYRNYKPSHNYNTFPDQLFVDNLYLDVNNLFDLVSIRIGRQDMKYGAGRVIADGTPADGSRSAYFDAVKMSFKVTDKTTGDLFASYTKDTDKFFTVGDADGSQYNITSYDGATGGADRIDDLEEWGLGTYWTMKEIDSVPMEFYLIYKGESRWYKGGKDAGNKIPGRNYATAGIRVTPKFTGDLKGDFEAAYQFGRTDSDSSRNIDAQDINAFMLYGGLTYTANSLDALKPYGTLAMLYLSGDDKHSAYDHTGGPKKGATGWNPVYGRYTYIGELPVKMYGSSYRWSNLLWPHAEAGFQFNVFDRKNAIKIQTGPMFADKDDRSGAPADNDSLYRGWYTQASYECTFVKEIVNKRGSIKGRLLAEHMTYGDYYYQSDRPDNGYFLRAEIAMTF
ncbi:MAG: alginate export family protein [Kiritimatiellaeota bacterium]|nr:alginate export family protein [Kiritimatiellota bacterium]